MQKLPFQHEDIHVTLQLVKEFNGNMQNYIDDTISSQELDFLKCLLNPKPNQRANIQQILKHPFLYSKGNELNISIQSFKSSISRNSHISSSSRYSGLTNTSQYSKPSSIKCISSFYTSNSFQFISKSGDLLCFFTNGDLLYCSSNCISKMNQNSSFPLKFIIHSTNSLLLHYCELTNDELHDFEKIRRGILLNSLSSYDIIRSSQNTDFDSFYSIMDSHSEYASDLVIPVPHTHPSSHNPNRYLPHTVGNYKKHTTLPRSVTDEYDSFYDIQDDNNESELDDYQYTIDSTFRYLNYPIKSSFIFIDDNMKEKSNLYNLNNKEQQNYKTYQLDSYTSPTLDDCYENIIQLLNKSKKYIPKVVIYFNIISSQIMSCRCKCMLMSNYPLPDFTIQFDDKTLLKYCLETSQIELTYYYNDIKHQWNGNICPLADCDFDSSIFDLQDNLKKYLLIGQKVLGITLDYKNKSTNKTSVGPEIITKSIEL